MTQRNLSPGQSTLLDFIRGLAAWSVLIGHSAQILLPSNPLAQMNMQGAGVFIFFLLSGFLITYSALRKHNDPSYGFGAYFIDRFCRIFIAYIPALFFVLIVDYFTLQFLAPGEIVNGYTDLGARYNLMTWFGNLFMMQDYPAFQILSVAGVIPESAAIKSFGSAAPFWTISIEWWIYMVFGVIALVYVRQKKWPKVWHWPLLGLIALEPFYHFVTGPDNCLTMLWVMGMLVCMLFLYPPKWLDFSNANIRIVMVLCALFAVVCMAMRIVGLRLDGSTDFLEFQFAVYMAMLVFGTLFFLSDKIDFPKFFKKISWFVADYSYSLYLTHHTIVIFLAAYFKRSDDPAIFWMAIVLSNLLAIFFWFLFERHYKRLARWMKMRFLGQKT